MDKFIAEANIEHYRRLLASDLSEQKRQSVMQLLADEKAKLRSMEGAQKQGQLFQPES